MASVKKLLSEIQWKDCKTFVPRVEFGKVIKVYDPECFRRPSDARPRIRSVCCRRRKEFPGDEVSLFGVPRSFFFLKKKQFKFVNLL